jgi:serine/threonine-protein kinase RsbW
LGPAAESIALGPHEMELRMLAVRDHVPGLRALVAERAMRLDHDLDFIDDVRLAVDEVCALVLANCTPADVLTLRLSVDSACVRINASVPTHPTGEPVIIGLSLRVLEALADSLDHTIDDNAAERTLRVGFARWRRRH